MSSTLYLLFAAVAMLLAIGCANVSILLLARGTARQHEFAVRSAIGASTFRIVRQLLVESLLLAFIGTGIGIPLAYALVRLIVAWMPTHMFPPDVAIGINTPVLLFSTGLALLTAVLFGLIPALQMARPEISQVMQVNSKRAAGTVRGKRVHGALVAGQIALTLLLLTAAGSAIQSFLRIVHIPLGYDPHNVISVLIPMQPNTYATWQARLNYFEELRAGIAELPDVTSAAISTNGTPPNGGWEQPFEFLGRPSQSPEAQTAKVAFVDASYFSTLHIPLVQGRIWSPAEVANGALLVLVNQSFAGRFSPDGGIVEHSIKLSKLIDNPPRVLTAPGAKGWMQVIGVVADALNDGLNRPIKPAILVPYSVQMPMGTHILVRTRVAPESVFPQRSHASHRSES